MTDATVRVTYRVAKFIGHRRGLGSEFTNVALSGACSVPEQSGTAKFAYDSVGNILTKWHQNKAPMSMSYDAASRIVTMIQGANLTSYVFDNAGNQWIENAVTVGGVTTNIYNGANRLVGIRYPNGALSTYAYSGDGLRRTLQDPGAPVTFTIWDGSDYLQEKS